MVAFVTPARAPWWWERAHYHALVQRKRQLNFFRDEHYTDNESITHEDAVGIVSDWSVGVV